MKVLIVYAHPGREGHCGCILKKSEEYLRSEDVSYEVLDLYAIDFNPVMRKEELANYIDNSPLPEIKKIQEKILAAEKMIFIYPTWWQNVPAILKGFFDRVFLPKFAYVFDDMVPKGLLKGKKTLIFTSTGSRRIFTRLLAGDRSIKTVKKDVLLFCGLKSKSVIIDNAGNLNEAQKSKIERMVIAALKRF